VVDGEAVQALAADYGQRYQAVKFVYPSFSLEIALVRVNTGKGFHQCR
jgi:hypothetical protein